MCSQNNIAFVYCFIFYSFFLDDRRPISCRHIFALFIYGLQNRPTGIQKSLNMLDCILITDRLQPHHALAV